MRDKIENYLNNFPLNTTSWAKATDEIRDLARASREYLEKYESIVIEPVDFANIKTPSEWNTQGRDYILSNFDRMNVRTREAFYESFKEWFEPCDVEIKNIINDFIKNQNPDTLESKNESKNIDGKYFRKK